MNGNIGRGRSARLREKRLCFVFRQVIADYGIVGIDKNRSGAVSANSRNQVGHDPGTLFRESKRQKRCSVVIFYAVAGSNPQCSVFVLIQTVYGELGQA